MTTAAILHEKTVEVPRLARHRATPVKGFTAHFIAGIRKPMFTGMLWGIALVTGVEGIYATVVHSFNF